jgi:hypothetical protein
MTRRLITNYQLTNTTDHHKNYRSVTRRLITNYQLTNTTDHHKHYRSICTMTRRLITNYQLTNTTDHHRHYRSICTMTRRLITNYQLRRYCLTTIDNYYSKLSISHAEITKSNIIRCNLVENGYSDNICIGKLNIFLNLTEWYFQCQRIDPDNGKYWSVWRHIVTFNTDKKNNTVLKVSTCIITSITARPVGLDAILATMSVSTCKAVGILYIETSMINTRMIWSLLCILNYW